MKVYGIDLVESQGIPEGELRVIDMIAVKKRIAIVDEPHPLTMSSEWVGDELRVTVSQPAIRFMDMQTGKILGE